MKSTAQFELAFGRVNLNLARTNIRAGTVRCKGLTEGVDFTVDAPNSRITVLPHVAGPFVFVEFEHDQPEPVAPTPIDVGSDDTDLRSQGQTAVQNLRDYLALQNPTNAQTIAAFKLLIRVVLGIIRFLRV